MPRVSFQMPGLGSAQLGAVSHCRALCTIAPVRKAQVSPLVPLVPSNDKSHLSLSTSTFLTSALGLEGLTHLPIYFVLQNCGQASLSSLGNYPAPTPYIALLYGAANCSGPQWAPGSLHAPHWLGPPIIAALAYSIHRPS